MPPTSKQAVSAQRVAELVSKAFTDAQRTCAAHPRAITHLLSAYRLSPKEFFHQFIRALNRILLVFSRDAHIERLVQFVANFASSDVSAKGSFCGVILRYILGHTNCRTPAVRFRTVQLVATILCKLPESAELSDDLLDRIHEAIIDRTVDRVPRVRAAAAGALCRMQGEANPESDECIATLLKMLVTDSSAAVRKAAVQAIAINQFTLSYVISRVRDVNAEVRRVVYETLAKKNVNPFELDRQDIIFLLRSGLQDRVKAVRNACQEKLLIQSWMTQACDGNVFELVELLGCHDDEATVLNVLKAVFQSEEFSQLVDSVHIDVNNLSGDDVLILRGMCEARRFEGGLDRFIQTTSDYANVLSYYAVSSVASKHLLELCKCVDLSDEAGRKNLQNVLCSSFLSSPHVEHDIIGNVIRALRRAVPEEEACARLVCDVVQDILIPDNDQLSKVSDSVGDGSSDNTVENWKTIRALKICCESLRSVPLKTAGLSNIYTTYGNLLNMVRLELSEDEEVRRLSLECISLYCLLDKTGEQARANVPIFFTACLKDIETIQDLALRALTDMTLLQGLPDGDLPIALPLPPESSEECESPNVKSYPQAFETPPESSEECEFPNVKSYPQAFEILLDRISREDSDARRLVVQCLVRLLYMGRIVPSKKILCQLLIDYHSPTTEDDDELRQCLSVFFPAYVARSGGHRLALEDAFKPTLRVLSDAPETSELKKISVLQVGQFIISLTEPRIGANTGTQTPAEIGRPADMIHERLAEDLLCEIMDSWDDNIVKVFTKILCSFRFACNEANRDKLGELHKLAKLASTNIENNRSGKMIAKFAEKLECDLARFDAELSEEGGERG